MVGNMDELADSGALARGSGALRRRPVGDGYPFFRGLLPAAQVHTAAWDVIAQLRQDGWVDDRETPSPGRPRGPRGLSQYILRGNPDGHAAIRWHVERLYRC
jgi:hypothetical protein